MGKILQEEGTYVGYVEGVGYIYQLNGGYYSYSGDGLKKVEI